MRRRDAVLAAMAGAFVATAAPARIVQVQTPSGPVWTNVPEPAGNRMPKPTSRRLPWQPLIEECSARHGVDARLVEAVIACESDFDPLAVSSAGAQGLMQLMPETAGLYGVTDPFDATQNVDAGTRHLRDLIRRFDGDWKLVAAAYNAGAGAVERSGGIPPFAETRHYVRKVQHYLREVGVSLPGAGADDDFGDGVSWVGDDDASLPDPLLDWKEPAAEAAPEPPPPPRRRGPAAVVVRDGSGRAIFTNRPEVKASAGARR